MKVFPNNLQRHRAAFRAHRRKVARGPHKDIPALWDLMVIGGTSLALNSFGPKVLAATEAFDNAMRGHPWDWHAWVRLALLLGFGLVFLFALVFGAASLRALTERINEHRGSRRIPKRTRPLRPRPRR